MKNSTDWHYWLQTIFRIAIVCMWSFGKVLKCIGKDLKCYYISNSDIRFCIIFIPRIEKEWFFYGFLFSILYTLYYSFFITLYYHFYCFNCLKYFY